MSEQVGWRGFVEHVRQEAPYWSTMLPQLPRLLHQALARQAQAADGWRLARDCCARSGGAIGCSRCIAVAARGDRRVVLLLAVASPGSAVPLQ